MRAHSHAISAATFRPTGASSAKNMPGAGSAARRFHQHGSAPRTAPPSPPIMPGVVMGALLDEKAEALFDPTKVLYLGTANNGTRVCVSRGESKSRPSTTCHAEGVLRRSLHQRLHPRIRLHCTRRQRARSMTSSPATGHRRIALAMERGESTAPCGWDWSSFKSQRPDGSRRHRSTSCCRSASSLNPELARLAFRRCSSMRQTRGRPQSGRAGDQPASLSSALVYCAARPRPRAARCPVRAGFDATMADRHSWIMPEKMRIDISPLSGAQVQALVQKLHAQPQGRCHARAQGDPHAMTNQAKPTWKQLLAGARPLLCPARMTHSPRG